MLCNFMFIKHHFFHFHLLKLHESACGKLTAYNKDLLVHKIMFAFHKCLFTKFQYPLPVEQYFVNAWAQGNEGMQP